MAKNFKNRITKYKRVKRIKSYAYHEESAALLDDTRGNSE